MQVLSNQHGFRDFLTKEFNNVVLDRSGHTFQWTGESCLWCTVYIYLKLTVFGCRLVTSSLGMNCTMHWQRVKSTSFTSILPTGATVDEWVHERFCEMWHLWDSCMDQG